MKMPEVKAVEAKGRQDYFNTLSTAQKIAHLDQQLGKGVGAQKQRAKLAKLLEQEAAEAKKPKKKESKNG